MCHLLHKEVSKLATVEEWQDYVDAYDADSVTARQHVNSVLNDPSASAADKETAKHDMIVQDLYSKWLHDTNDTIQQSGIIPDTLHFDGGTIYGGLWSDGTDIKTGFVYTYSIGTILPGSTSYKLPVCCLDGNDLSIDATSSTTANLRFDCYRWTDLGTAFQVTFIILNTDASGDIRWKFGGVDVTYAAYTRNGWCCYYRFGNSTPPVHADFNNLARVAAASSPNWSQEPIIGVISLINQAGFDVDPDAPWDAYNDNILPNVDPDNAVFPGGYEPTLPDEPGDEPQNLPHDDGEPPENQTDRSLSVPMNFITQYVLDADELMTVGVNLWQSWLTPNTDVWMNFFLPYAQDFGTLNIGACMDFIISLRVYPFEFTLDMFVNQPDGLRMGTGHTDFYGGSIPIIKTQIYCIDMGTCEVKPVTPYNDFRDMYNTSVLLFLPYCGTVELNPAEVIGRTLHAYYFIDFQSGGCTAVVTCVGDAGEYNIASKSGQIGFSIPLTATNAGQIAAQTMKDAVETVGTIGGLVFDIAKNQADNLFSMAGAFLSKPTAISEDKQGKKSLNAFSNNTFETSLKSGESAFNAGLSLANQALDRLSRSGIGMPMLSGGSGAEAMMFPDCVSIQIRRGKYAKPVNYPHSQGHLNGSSGKISEYAGSFKGTPTIPSEYEGRGLAKFTGIDTTGLTCHADERAEIVALLESGIYI